MCPVYTLVKGEGNLRFGRFAGSKAELIVELKAHCLWTLKRLMYYVYGGWAQGINLNEYPPAAAYLFGKQIYDESTHEMQFADEILRHMRHSIEESEEVEKEYD